MFKDSTKKYSSIQEKRLAKSLGGKLQLASGALPIASQKGDVRVSGSENWKILIDGKTTMAKTHQAGVRSKEIKKDWMNKIEQEAREGGYDIGVLAFSFDNKEDFYILKDIDFKNLYQAVTDYEELVNKLNEKIKLLEDNLNSKPLKGDS